MRKALGIVVLLCCCTLIRAQQQMLFEKSWGIDQNGYSDGFMYADQLGDGSYMLIGWTTVAFQNLKQHYACRIDSTGGIIWESTWGIPDSRSQFAKAVRLTDGTYLAVGQGLGTGGGLSDMIVSRINADGNVIFCNYYDFGYEDKAFDLEQTYDGAFLITGVKGTAPGSWHPAYLKIDADGNEIWRRTQSIYAEYTPYCVSQTADSGFIVLGQTWAANYYNSYYAKFDSAGIMQWIKYPFGLGDSSDNNPGNVRANNDGTSDIYYRTNYTVGAPPTTVAGLFVRYDQYGDTVWTKQYDEFRGRIFVRDDSTIYAVRNSNGFAEMNSAYQWEERNESGGMGVVNDYILTSDGGMLGFGYLIGSTSGNQFYIVKYAPDGRYQSEPFLSTITIAPNPSADGNIVASFDVQTDENVQVRVVGMDGRLVYYNEIFCPANSHTDLPIRLDVETISAGIYILEVKTNTEYRRKKLVIGRQQ